MHKHELIAVSGSEDGVVEAPPRSKWLLLSGPAGNFCIQYNLSCLAIALVLGSTSHGTDADGPHVLKVPGWVDNVLFAVVFAGCVGGMVIMGILGDVIGRHRGLVVTSSCIALAAIGSAFCTLARGTTMWNILIVCRLLLGFGIGGVYPLGAATVSDLDTTSDEESILRPAVTVAWSFFWQAPGIMAPYLVSLLLICANVPHELAFRCVLAFGAVPALVVCGVNMSVPDTNSAARRHCKTAFFAGVAREEYWRLLCGTGGTWLIFDVAYYGVTIFTPFILKTIFENEGRTLSPTDLCIRSIFSACFACGGNLASVGFLRRWDVKTLNTVGFCLMAFSLLLLALSCPGSTHSWSSDVQFILFTFLLCTFSFGPMTATYVLPTEVFPSNVRSTFHGLSSGAGKIGALIGAYLYPRVRTMGFPLGYIMAGQVGVCLLGALVSHFCIPSIQDTIEQDDEENNNIKT